MQSAATLRNWQIEQLRKNIRVIGHVVLNAPALDATTYHDGGTGWSVYEVMRHLRQFEQVFIDRARVTLEQDSGDLPFPDPDEMMRSDLKPIHLPTEYAEWVQLRETLLDCFASLDEAAWARTANHPRRGSISLSDQLMLTVWHDNNHLEQIAKILEEKQIKT